MRHPRIENTLYRIKFIVAEKLEVDDIVGTAFMNRHFNAVICPEQKIKLRKGTILIMGQGNIKLRLSYRQFDYSTWRRNKSLTLRSDDRPPPPAAVRLRPSLPMIDSPSPAWCPLTRKSRLWCSLLKWDSLLSNLTRTSRRFIRSRYPMGRLSFPQRSIHCRPIQFWGTTSQVA